MTGRDLIIYILTNNLEDEPVFMDKGFLNLMSEAEAAAKMEVGVATIRALVELGAIKGIRLGNEIYILPNG